jgi:hypothetical protein
MAELATYVGIEPRTAIATNVAQARGVRVTRNSSGVTAVADATTRGDYVTLTDIAASSAGQVASLSGGGKIPALASEATVVGDLAYAAAAGKFSKTSTNAALLGRWTLAASGDGVLGEVELFSVA